MMIVLLSAVRYSTQEIRETLELRRNLTKLIEAKLDQDVDSDLNSSLVHYYAKTLRELKRFHFKKNIYSISTTVHRLASLQCYVGISCRYVDSVFHHAKSSPVWSNCEAFVAILKHLEDLVSNGTYMYMYAF